MTEDDFDSLAQLGTARVSYRRKHAHHINVEGRPVWRGDGIPHILVTQLVPVDYMEGVSLVKTVDLTPSDEPVLVHYLNELGLVCDLLDFPRDGGKPLPAHLITKTRNEVTCPHCARGLLVTVKGTRQ